jgi:hypothetical protein
MEGVMMAAKMSVAKSRKRKQKGGLRAEKRDNRTIGLFWHSLFEDGRVETLWEYSIRACVRSQ